VIFLAAIVAAFIPALLWLWFFNTRDRYEREPKSLILKLFLWGVLSGPWAAGFNDMFSQIWGPVIKEAPSFGLFAVLLLVMVYVLALNEETIKFMVTNNEVRGDKNFNEPVDGMIYITAAALGFAAGENTLYIIGSFFGVFEAAVKAGTPAQGALTQALITSFGILAPIRSLITAVGHVTWSGITGYYLGKVVVGGGSKRLVTLGVFLAGLLHTSFNYPQFLGSVLQPNAGFLSGFFLMALVAWLIGLIIYFRLLRRALAVSPFRTQQIAAPAPAPAKP
jgi:RsiW-degrading membrane proteinase PrsW (M82 family)